MPNAIEVKGLTKSFGDFLAVDKLSLSIKEGEIFGFLGPNGSGKTTTIRMLCGLLLPSGGSGQCLGYDILRDSTKIRANIGYMTQKFSLYGDLTVRENLNFVAKLFRCQPLSERVDTQLEEYALMDRQHQLSGNLSGGWKQRLALAACSISRPKLLILDEPTAGVDPYARRQFWAKIQRLSDDGVTTMVSTHYMDEAIRCDRISYLLNGRLLVIGSCDEVVANSGLFSISVRGRNNFSLQDKLMTHPDVASVAIYGANVNISGRSLARITEIVRREDPKAEIKQIEPGLEDVFVSLAKGRLEGRVV